jgi:hypothetical protein
MTKSQQQTTHSKVRRFATYSILAFAVMTTGASRALAQDEHSHMSAPANEMTREQRSKASALLKIVRDSTCRFKDVSVAIAEGYAPSIRLRERLRFGSHGTPLRERNLVNGGVLGPLVPRSSSTSRCRTAP